MIVKQELVNILEVNKIIKDSQHGFRSNRSCLTSLLEFSENILEGIDNGEALDVIFLDLKKAFDTVPHCRLIMKLEAIGIHDKLLCWIKDWLSERKQRVVLDGVESEWVDVCSGVPQGSVLGPVLFIIFINDMEDKIRNLIWKVADDAKLVGKVDGQEDVIYLQDLDKL